MGLYEGFSMAGITDRPFIDRQNLTSFYKYVIKIENMALFRLFVFNRSLQEIVSLPQIFFLIEPENYENYTFFEWS